LPTLKKVYNTYTDRAVSRMLDLKKALKMANTTKTANYTPEQAAAIVAAYVANPSPDTVATLAEQFGKTVKSVVAKLSREGVYKKKEYTTKTGDKVVKKDAHADAIGAILKMSEGEIDSLTKANKTALVKIFDALANSRPIGD
jgi:electron transfer flavoprotein alpha subunit